MKNLLLSKQIYYLFFILCAIFWGGSYTAIKIMAAYTPPFFGGALRLIVAFLFLDIVLRLTRQSFDLTWSIRSKMWLIGLFCFGIPFAFLFWAEQFVSPGLAGILGATTPIWILILNMLIPSFRTTPITAKKLLGLTLGILGVVIIFWPMLNFKNGSHDIFGSAAILVMSFSYAIGTLLSQRLLLNAQVPFLANTYHQLFSSSILLSILGIIFEKMPNFSGLIHTPTFILACGYLGIVSTTIAWLMFYALIREWGALRASSTTYLAPGAALLWDWLFFKTIPHVEDIIGVTIILLGVFMIQSQGKKISTPAPAPLR